MICLFRAFDIRYTFLLNLVPYWLQSCLFFFLLLFKFFLLVNMLISSTKVDSEHTHSRLESSRLKSHDIHFCHSYQNRDSQPTFFQCLTNLSQVIRMEIFRKSSQTYLLWCYPPLLHKQVTSARQRALCKGSRQRRYCILLPAGRDYWLDHYDDMTLHRWRIRKWAERWYFDRWGTPT